MKLYLRTLKITLASCGCFLVIGCNDDVINTEIEGVVIEVSKEFGMIKIIDSGHPIIRVHIYNDSHKIYAKGYNNIDLIVAEFKTDEPKGVTLVRYIPNEESYDAVTYNKDGTVNQRTNLEHVVPNQSR